MKINRILQIALLMELFLGALGGQTAIASDPSLDPHLCRRSLNVNSVEAGLSAEDQRCLV